MSAIFQQDGTLSVLSLYDFAGIPTSNVRPDFNRLALSPDGSKVYAISLLGVGSVLWEGSLQEIDLDTGSIGRAEQGWDPQRKFSDDPYAYSYSAYVDGYDVSADGGTVAISGQNDIIPSSGHPIPSSFNLGVHVVQNGAWTQLTPHFNEPGEAEHASDILQLWWQQSFLLGVADDGTAYAQYHVTYSDLYEDGRLIAPSQHADVDRLVALEPDGEIRDLGFALTGDTAYGVSADGRYALTGLAYGGDGFHPLWRIDLQTGVAAAVIHDGAYSGKNSLSALGMSSHDVPTISDSGRFVLYASRGHADVADAGNDPDATDIDYILEDMTDRAMLRIETLPYTDVTMSGDGRFVAYVARSAAYPQTGLVDIVVLDRYDDSTRIVSEGLSGRDHRGLIDVFELAFSADGSVLAALTDVEAALHMPQATNDIRVIDLQERGDWIPILRHSDGNQPLEGLPWSEVLIGAPSQFDTLIGAEGDDTLLGDGFLPAYALDVAAAINTLYLVGLGRHADPVGMATWGERVLAQQLSLQDVATAITASKEFRTGHGMLPDDLFAAHVLRTGLQRAIPEETLTHYSNALAHGTPRGEILASVALSPEALAGNDLPYHQSERLLNATTPDAYIAGVTRLYQTAFARLPDPEGLQHWVTKLMDGMSLRDVALAFADGAEPIAQGAVRYDLVNTLYENALGRPRQGSEGGEWEIGHLGLGFTDTGTILHSVAQSAEARRHLTETDVTAVVRALGVDDVLVAEEGKDTLYGGLWSDVFVFAADSGGEHRVMDLDSWDQVDLTAFEYADLAEALTHFQADGDDLVFQDRSVTITFMQTALPEITDSLLLI